MLRDSISFLLMENDVEDFALIRLLGFDSLSISDVINIKLHKPASMCGITPMTGVLRHTCQCCGLQSLTVSSCPLQAVPGLLCHPRLLPPPPPPTASFVLWT